MKYLQYKIKFSLLLIIGLFGANYCLGQTANSYISRADTSFKEKDYCTAYNYYKAALLFDLEKEDSLRILYQKGITAYEINAVDVAINTFDTLLQLLDDTSYPDIVYWMAKTYYKRGEYKKASEEYSKFLTQSFNASKAVLSNAKKDSANLNWILSQLVAEPIPQPYRLFNPKQQNLGPSVNGAYSDFAGLFLNDTIFYSHIDPTDRGSCQLMELRRIQKEDTLYAVFNPTNQDIKKQQSIIHPSFTLSQDRNTIYYCECEKINAKDLNCTLMSATKSGDNLWTNLGRLNINIDGYNSNHPAIGINPMDGSEILYFSSDRPGGKGGMDIWYAKINDDGTLGTPVNLESLNTPDDEKAPFYHPASLMLYFSSNAAPTYGGYDIFASKVIGGWGARENLGRFVNSGYDELHYSLSADGTEAIYDSDRPNINLLTGADGGCCSDIYFIQGELPPPIELEVLTFDSADLSPLANTDITLELIDLGDQPLPALSEINFDFLRENDFQVMDTVVNTGTANNAFFEIQANQIYVVKGMKEKYVPDSAIITTFNLLGGEKIKQNLFLKKDLFNLIIYTFINEPLINAEQDTIYPPLQGCTVSVEKDPNVINSTNVFRNTFDTTHIFRKRGLDPDSFYFIDGSNPDFPNPEPSTISPDLIKREIVRGNRTIEVSLYFPPPPTERTILAFYDNAKPNDYQLNTLKLDYEGLVPQYQAKREEYQNRYIGGMPDTLSTSDVQDIKTYYGDFFAETAIGADGLIPASLTSLRQARKDIMYYLEKGDVVEVQLIGTASPVGNPIFNQQLSVRRITAVKNFLMKGRASNSNKTMKDFLPKNNVLCDPSALLCIKENPLGESEAELEQTLQIFLRGKALIQGHPIQGRGVDRSKKVNSLLAGMRRKVQLTYRVIKK